MSLWETITSHPAATSFAESLDRLFNTLEHVARTTEPSTWMLLALGFCALWMLVLVKVK